MLTGRAMDFPLTVTHLLDRVRTFFPRREVVTRRHIVTREDFLTTYALGRIVPTGTMTAVAVGIGHRLGGFGGTVAALLGLTLPAFVSTVGLTAAYRQLQDTRGFALLSVTLLPAALSLVVAAAVNLARSAIGRRPEMALAVAALIASLLFLGGLIITGWSAAMNSLHVEIDDVLVED